MLIQYKVKFREDGLTLTQRYEPDSDTTDEFQAPPFVNSNQLLSTYAASKAQTSQTQTPGPVAVAKARSDNGKGGEPKTNTGKGGEDKTKSGHGGEGSSDGPVTFIGPFFFCCPRPEKKKKRKKKQEDTSNG